SYGTGFLLLFLSVFGLGQDFQHSLSQLSTVQRYLSQYQLFLQQNNNPESSISALTSALPLLNTLETATTTQADNSRLKQIKTPYSVKSQQTAIGIYHKALQTIVLPQIRNEFEKYLENSSDKNPEQLYAALKAYLLLRRQDSETAFSTGAAQVKQIPFIIQTLEQISPAFSKKSPIKELRQTIFLQHLQNALQLKPSNLLNNRLIKQVRKTLNSLPETDLAYLLIKNKNNNSKESELSLGTNIGIPPALISKGTLTQIPCLFTASVFGTVIQEELQEAADETINGNEVLGKKFYRSDALISSTEASTLLKQELEKKYINNYIDVWESLVDNISINLPKNLTETDALIMNLISTHSPLLQLLQTIHSNINLPPILTNSFKLQALNTLFNQTETQQKDSLYEIFTDLHELHQFLQQASLGELPEGSKLHNPISRIRNTAEKYPEPIKTWLQTLVSSTQNYLQQKSGGNENKKISIKEAALESNFQNLLVIPKPYLQTKQSLLLGADILA
ncbi:MAG TPA: ImcF-related family protein, partial [Gammaproteobacteria bacterium]|nr:ImcF-related family protein [Gammaproteobacteria bacterium]